MDLDPFCPIGITEGTIRLLDVFLLHCLLRDSPPDTPQELAAIVRNQQRVAARGREPGLRLTNGSHEVAFAEWGGQVLDECEPIATALDAANETTAHREALAAAVAALHDPAMTPSARVLQTMERDYGELVHALRPRAVACASRCDSAIAVPRRRRRSFCAPGRGIDRRTTQDRSGRYAAPSKPTGSCTSRRCASPSESGTSMRPIGVGMANPTPRSCRERRSTA